MPTPRLRAIDRIRRRLCIAAPAARLPRSEVPDIASKRFAARESSPPARMSRALILMTRAGSVSPIALECAPESRRHTRQTASYPNDRLHKTGIRVDSGVIVRAIDSPPNTKHLLNGSVGTYRDRNDSPTTCLNPLLRSPPRMIVVYCAVHFYSHGSGRLKSSKAQEIARCADALHDSHHVETEVASHHVE